MNRFVWFLFGIVFLCAAVVVASAVFILNAHGFSASEKPSSVERWIARRARFMAFPSDARSRANPEPNTPQALAEARAHWADHCALCHANDGSGDTPVGK